MKRKQVTGIMCARAEYLHDIFSNIVEPESAFMDITIFSQPTFIPISAPDNS